MPLSSSVLVNRDEVLDLIAEMQEALPDEIKQARWIVKDREDLLAKARADARGDRRAGPRREQLKMARQEAVVARAGEEAERVLGEADEQSRSMRREAEEYVDGKLAQFEIALRRVLEDSPVLGSRARQDPRSGRGRPREAAHARHCRRSGVRGARTGVGRSRPAARRPLSTTRRSDDRADRRSRPARSAGRIDASPQSAARRRPRHRARAGARRRCPSRPTCCSSRWSRASWSRARCEARCRCGARGASGSSSSRSPSRCTSCSCPSPRMTPTTTRSIPTA